MNTFAIVGIVFLVIIIIPLAALLINSPGTIEPYHSADGSVLSNSISEKCFVNINNSKQGMIIRGENKDNPVVLFVHGGPGMPEYFMAEQYKTSLEKYFTVCYWDQRGAGISYNPDISSNSITVEQLVADTSAVAQYLKERFGKEKVYLLGHSWGSFIAIQSAAKNPELYCSYIAMSQICNTIKSEQIDYDYMLKRYEESGNTSMINKLKKYDIFNNQSDFCEYQQSILRDKCMHSLGIGTCHNMNSVVTGIFFPVMACKAYTVNEKIGIWVAKFCLHRDTSLDSTLYSTDLTKTLVKLSVPVYFMGGIYDYTVNYDMQKEYYKLIGAPRKGFYSFRKSAHSPLFEEPERFIDIMLNDVLNEKTNLAD